MSTVSFSSPLTPAAFTAFTLNSVDRRSLKTFRDDDQQRWGLSFTGSNLKAARDNLAAIAVMGLLNGGPLMTLGGHLVAAAVGQGQLVTVTIDTSVVSRTGIITNLVWQVGEGSGFPQRLDLVLARCHRLHVRSGGTVTTSTDPAVS